MNLEGMFVLSPCASRLAEGDVVRHGVQTPLQTAPRLVPTHQGSQPGHCLHRGNSNDDRNTDARSRQGVKTFPPVLFESMLLHVLQIRISPQLSGRFAASQPAAAQFCRPV